MNVNTVFGPFIAFLAGLLSFISPCVLPLVPVYLAQMAGNTAGFADGAGARRRALLHSASFVAGFSLVFIVLGASVGLIGYALKDHERELARIAGVLIVIMGMHLAGIIRIPFLNRTYSVPIRVPVAAGAGAGVETAVTQPATRPAMPVLNYGRSSLLGMGFALGWTPCIGPVLGTILGLAYAQGTVAKGAVLLVCYSLGLGVPFLVTGMAVGTVTAGLKKINRFLPAIEFASGVLLIAVGVLLIADRMTMFNSYFDFFGVGTKGL
ncbi:MAG: cytochrome c biogenesis CcdA family protein [Dehalococcoidia bacterium]